MSKGIYESKPWLKHYDSHVPKTLEYPNVSLSHFVDASVKEFPESPMMIQGKRIISFKEFGNYKDSFAAALTEMGVKKGDRVGIYCLNMPQYLIALYGAFKIGAVPTGINPLLTPRELKYIVDDSDAETIVALDLFLPRVQEIRKETKLKNVIVAGLGDFPQEGPLPEPPEYEGAVSFLELLKYEPKPPEVKINPREDWALLQYTAGTTGLPKGTILTHENMVKQTTQLIAWLKFERGKEIVCSSFPFFHLAGLEFNIGCVSQAAGQILIANPRDIEGTINLIDQYHPTIICNVPTIYIQLLRHPKFEKSAIKKAKMFISGAAAFPPEIINEYNSKTEGVVLEVWGMTEASPVLTANPVDGLRKVGSVGIPLSDTIVKVVDLETGEEELPIGEQGELVAYGPQVFYKGYWKKAEETKKALKEGWYYTGDIGYMDKDGYFYIVDRKKDIINVSGYKVASREVDDVLFEHPAVNMAATIGLPDPDRPGSEIVKAFVILKEGYEGSPKLAEEIRQFLKKSLAPYKVPKIVEFKKELPLSATGKVLKRELREEEKAKMKK
ncbi:MAG: AMP-binding protein [Candidatus Jordarchaeum sp.]|uniref:AMP-binding protein n=1 Tax=Candidatus Jordarchaeum sp. TaxID=2823881 RepID=UPI004049C023